MSLIKDDNGDYILEENKSTWVTVGNLSVYLYHVNGELMIDVWPKGEEANDSIATIRRATK